MPTAAAQWSIAPEMLRGLTILGPYEGKGPDLALEFGMSAWLRLGATDAARACLVLTSLRAAVLEVAEMDPRCEPVPMSGRSARIDVLTAAGLLSELVVRAAHATGTSPQSLAEAAIELLSSSPVDEPEEHADEPEVLATILPFVR
jgi:hypothetical protein